MTQKVRKSGLTLIELMVALVVVALLMTYIWKLYFGGRETMRNTVSQSQIQADTRLFLDKFENQMASSYSFYEMDPEQHKFGFYTFTFSRTPLDEIYYDHTGKLKKTGKTSTQHIRVAKYEYVWNPKTKTVTENRDPGWLEFLQQPMKFIEGKDTNFPRYHKKSKVVLKNIEQFTFKGYNQIPDIKQNSGFKIVPTTKTTATSTVFITLRIHTQKKEGKNRRSEELDIVNKFYCKTKLSMVTHPNFFSSTDQDGRF